MANLTGKVATGICMGSMNFQRSNNVIEVDAGADAIIVARWTTRCGAMVGNAPGKSKE
jgi:hypothetical protein